MMRDTARHRATDSDEISVQQEKAIAALLAGQPVREAAKHAGVNRGTLHRWLTNDAVFIATYNFARKERTDAVLHELRKLGAEAVEVVRTLMTCAETPATLKLKAAISILEAVTDESHGSTDVEEIRLQLKEEVRRRKDRVELLNHFK
jgi:AcrR family transcriptional regulator